VQSASKYKRWRDIGCECECEVSRARDTQARFIIESVDVGIKRITNATALCLTYVQLRLENYGISNNGKWAFGRAELRGRGRLFLVTANLVRVNPLPPLLYRELVFDRGRP